MINYNGAGFRPEIEDVWPYEKKPVYESHQFVSHFIAYAKRKKELENQLLAEVEYNYDENI